MANKLVIVAIPAEDDPVWKISSEKVPHMTILFLGDGDNPERGKMAQFLLHAADTSLTRFGLDVERRGTLGEDEADVVFFNDSWELPRLREFRSQLLKESTIRTAYDSVEQFPAWIPHLTLGYPGAPARESKDAWENRIHYVSFDKVALWDKPDAGVEFLLKRDNYNLEPMGVGVGMSAIATRVKGEAFLAHYGVKGMKWGVRKDNSSGAEHSPEATAAAAARAKLKTQGIKSLSNKELQDLTNRINLETKVRDLNSKGTKIKKGHDKVKAILAVGATINAAVALAQSPAGKEIAKVLKRRG